MSEWDILWRLGLALVLSSAIGVEREMRQKSAGLRTHALVGVGSAVFMLVSAYGFGDVVGPHVTLDPSRVAAQIVSGIGFIGGGIIFVRRDVVRGLTTAAAVWVTAGVGMACGGDLPILATATTVVYMVVAYGFAPLANWLPRSRYAPSDMRLVYRQGVGTLREALALASQRGFTIVDVDIKRNGSSGLNGSSALNGHGVQVDLEIRGPAHLNELAAELHDLDGMIEVHTGDATGVVY